ncbi:MAG TPA: protein kinase [Pseudonocardiaceae bacterium]
MTTPTGITPADPAPRLVAGRYRLGAVLGRGAMGTVWSAHDEVLGRAVAIKEVLLPPGIPDAEADVLRERSLREARAIAALSHPNVVTLYDVAREEGAPFVVMELVASHSLAQLLRRGALAPQRVIAVGAAVAAALQAAHAAGITHRDVKPGNVLVAHDGRIKLTDFGIARNPADQTMTATGLMLGSPAYIAPEVASGAAVSPAADLWGLGATLFAAVEGRPPYDAGDPVTTVSSVVQGEVPAPSCSGPLAEVIAGLMVKDPAARMPLSRVRGLLGPPQLAEPAPSAQEAGPSAPPTGRAVSRPGKPAPSSGSSSASSSASSSGQLAAEPGPLPFAVPAADQTTGRGAGDSGSTGRGVLRSAVLLWTLAVVLFLGAAAGGFAAARVASGATALPVLRPGTAQPGNDATLVSRQIEVAEADGSHPGRFTISVPTGWPEFHQHGVLGDNSGTAVRFVSPDGTEVIAVERVTGFLAHHLPEDYLTSYRRELADVPDLVVGPRTPLPDGGVDTTLRTNEGKGARGDLRRTSYLRLVPTGPDLWVVRVSVPTEQEAIARTSLFEPVVSEFRPAAP